MLYVITHIRYYVFNKSNVNHRNKLNTVIKTLFSCSSKKYLDTFWSEYSNFNHENNSFDSNKFICISKGIHDVNNNLWHQNYYLPCTKAFGFLACRVT